MESFDENEKINDNEKLIFEEFRNMAVVQKNKIKIDMEKMKKIYDGIELLNGSENRISFITKLNLNSVELLKLRDSPFCTELEAPLSYLFTMTLIKEGFENMNTVVSKK